MDNMQFGAFVAHLRKEQGLTQKELANKLNVTDKAVSKWETGKGFPDVKLLEPIAQVLQVSLVELMQGRRQGAETLTVAEADAAVSQAMGQSERTTTRRYLRLFRWFLTACVLGLVWLYPLSKFWIHGGHGIASASDIFTIDDMESSIEYFVTTDTGVISNADGPVAVFAARHPANFLDLFLQIGAPILLLIVCIVLAVKVWRLEKRLK